MIRSIRTGFLKIPLLGKYVAFRRLEKLIPISVLKRHGFVVAKSGSGKSEFLKVLLLRIKMTLKWYRPWLRLHQRRTCIVLDPHGDLVRECARLNYFSNEATRKTVFITPDFSDSGFPTLNPFDLHGKAYSDLELEVLAQNLSSVFTAMLSQGDVRLSLQMKTVLKPVLTVLLRLSRDGKRNTTFFDLERFLDDQRNEDLVAYAASQLQGEGQRRFFRHLFKDPKFTPTKFSLRSKLAGLLNAQLFVELLSREHSSWNLQDLMNRGSTVLIDASKSTLGKDVGEIFGRTIVALVQSYAMLRPSGPKVPTFFIIDEAASFVGGDIKTILTEARKFGLHLILVNQLVKQGNLSREFHDTIMGNTALKVVGNAGEATKQVMARECETDKDHFRNLRVGTFVIKCDAARPVKVTMPNFWLRGKHASTKKRWNRFQAQQIAWYYRDQRQRNNGDEPKMQSDFVTGAHEAPAVGKPRAGRPRPLDFS